MFRGCFRCFGVFRAVLGRFGALSGVFVQGCSWSSGELLISPCEQGTITDAVPDVRRALKGLPALCEGNGRHPLVMLYNMLHWACARTNFRDRGHWSQETSTNQVLTMHIAPASLRRRLNRRTL